MAFEPNGNIKRSPERSQQAPAERRREPKVDELTLVTSAAGASPQTLVVRMTIPSGRLRAAITIAWWGQGQPDIVGSTLDIAPIMKDAGGDETTMPNIVTGQTLPYSANLDPMADGYLVTITAVRPAGTLRGKMKAVAKWEPTNEMSTEEWASVRAACSLLPYTQVGAGIGA